MQTLARDVSIFWRIISNFDFTFFFTGANNSNKKNFIKNSAISLDFFTPNNIFVRLTPPII